MSENGASVGAAGVDTRELQELLRSLKETIMELRETVDEIYNPVMRRSMKSVQEHVVAAAENNSIQQDESAGKYGSSVSSVSKDPGAPRGEDKGSTGSGSGSSNGHAMHGTGRCMQDESLERNGRGRVGSVVGSGPEHTSAGNGSGNGGLHGIGSMQGLGGLLASMRNGEMDLSRLAGLLRLLYDLQTKVPPEYLAGMADILYDSGLVDERQRDTLKRLIELARIGREHGLSIDESIAILAALARELGLDITQVTDQLVRAILEARGGAAAWEPQQQ